MAAPAMISSAAQHHQLPPPANLISIATPSRDSMTFTSTKGLLNGPGQNNCFLNSAVQVLWHLDIFRRSFRDLSGHACMAESCIFCALKELFSQLQFSNETALPPDALRRALAESFFDQQRFQLGFMDDAAECFENMLLRIHMHIAHGEAEDMCNAKHCIPHQKFAMTLVEQSVCGSCGATSEPLSYTQMVHYVSTSTLVYQARNRSQNNVDPFGQLLRNAGSQGDVRYCPSACGAVIQIGRTLMNRPEIVSVGLVWNSERPTLEHIMEVFSSIGTTLRLSDVFNTVVDSRWAENCIHSLVGVVTYYGKHYSTFFFHTKLRVWIYFDDATVREVGPRWDQVVEKCRKGRYQPLLLLYALPDGTPVNTENAPKQVTPFYADNKLGNKKPPTPQTNNLRRSVTPSPEKPIVGNTRRAITPNPDSTAKPPLPRPYNEYQNLSVIQSNINLYNNRSTAGVDTVDGDLPRREPEYVTRKLILDGGQKLPNVHRTLSNGSSSGTEMCFRDYLNIPRTRDSGNWSSDRNSASSSSSTTMENPYSYLVGKVNQENGSGVPMPPRNDSSSSNSSGVYDVGYDSYSLSSNDSSTMTTIQHLMKMGHLAKIPEDYNTPPAQISQSCDVLCDEADELLVKSRQLEDEHDLVLALALCNAAATKTRAAMDAPYNNPQTLTLARMKHNTCIMRARSLHRRMTQSQMNQNKDFAPEIRHTREGSSGSGKHSRQNSRDKTQHSRQNSREMLEKPQPAATKSIEIYATLPKKKDGLKKIAVNIEDDPDYVLYDKPPGRETRSIFSRSKNKEANKAREKRSRSEDRNKMSRDFSIAPEIITGKDTLKREKVKEEKEEKKDKDGKPKKQHKIRRKLMGGLIRRKNRSMPDLTDTNVDTEAVVERPSSTVDDSNIGLKDNSANNMCGYLSEGHLEFTGNSTNPNLERSKLMRKSFHNSAGKILAVAKVPPPPPLRTTSQLSSNVKLNGNEVYEDKIEMQQQNFYQQQLYAQNGRYPHIVNNNPDFSNAPLSLPYNMNPHYPQIQNTNFNNQYGRNNLTYHAPESNMVVTRADVHQEREQFVPPMEDGVDEVDCMPSRTTSLDLPPYPSPLGSAMHSRQASEEFPPPPPPLDLSALDEHLTKENSPPATPSPGSLLAQLQNKRQEILSQDSESKLNNTAELVKSSSGGDIWLKELQAKQAALRMKKNPGGDTNCNNNIITTQLLAGESDSKVVSSVKDLANRFENVQIQPPEVNNKNASVPSIKPSEANDKRQALSPEQAKEIHQVESTTTTAAIQKILDAPSSADLVSEDQNKKSKLTKKKSVSFCDQVILVATAEDQEDDSYIPNPILERVLRSAMNKPETASIRQELLEKRQAETALLERTANEHSASSPKIIEENPYGYHQPLYVRRNSLDNLLSKPEPIVSPVVPSTDLEGNYISHSSDPNKHIYGTSPQYNMQQNARQSPYQRIPSNSPVYNAYNNYHAASGNRSPIVPSSTSPTIQNPSHPLNPQQTRIHQSPSYIYPQEYNNCANNPAPRTAYAQQLPQIRQSPNPSSQQSQQNLYPNQTYHPVYQHPPSPSPSNISSNYNYQQPTYSTRQNLTPNSLDSANRAQYSPSYGQRVATPLEQTPAQQQMTVVNSPYQRLPAPPENIEYSQNYLPSCYQTSPVDNNNAISYPPQRYPADGNNYYQRVPPPHMDHEMMASYQNQNQQQASKYSPYQQVPPPKQMLLKKTVSFEPGTKGGAESPTPKAVVTPIIVNNANNSVPTGKTKCNLCRKKATVSSNLYCMDCEFYMSRFKPKR